MLMLKLYFVPFFYLFINPTHLYAYLNMYSDCFVFFFNNDTSTDMVLLVLFCLSQYSMFNISTYIPVFAIGAFLIFVIRLRHMNELKFPHF